MQDFEAHFSSRLEKLSKLFGTNTKPSHSGKKAIFWEKDTTLEVFYPSDSLWWTHRELAYGEEPIDTANLPHEGTIRELADGHLAKLGLADPHASFNRAAYSRVAISNRPKQAPEEAVSEVHVLYRFELDALPTFGPGAKIKVSFAAEERMSILLFFWRKPIEVEVLPMISPQQALERFCSEPRFKRMSPESTTVEIQGLRLGYYTAAPDIFQRYLVPVYAVEATAHTEEIKHDAFTHYIIAADAAPEHLKKLGVALNPLSCS